MSVARVHAEWLSLLEISGPFLSMEVLLRTFPQGLRGADTPLTARTRLAFEEWRDNQGGLQPDPALHQAWLRFVLTELLELPDAALRSGQALPATLQVTLPEHGETLRPDLAIQHPTRAEPPRMLVTLLPASQKLEQPLPGHRWKAAPPTRMLELLRATEVPLGLLTNGEQWMLIAAPHSETPSFVSWYAELWLDEPLTLRAWRDLLGVLRLFGVAEAETLPALLRESAANQQEVTDQLGAQVRAAVELLVQVLDRIDQDQQRTLLAGLPPTRLYEAALTVMMRLVFLFSAEERGLLLLGDQLYDQFYAVSTLRALLREAADHSGEEILERRFDAWSRLLATFRMVYGGVEHETLRLPAYGGTLFDPDRFAFLEGRAPGSDWRSTPARPLPVDNRTVLHLLEALQILRVPVPGGGAEPRRLSFRALDIEQIGHVYEGLLDHTARRAAAPLLGLKGTRDREPELELAELERRQAQGADALLSFLKDATGRALSALRRELNQPLELVDQGRLRAACHNDAALLARVLPWQALLREDSFGRPVVVTAGSVFVTAGADRRATGTHYTPRALTEPLVQHALEPLVYSGPAEGRPRAEWRLLPAEALLELKVCDMAMGSGAFLVQACRYLAERLAEAWELAAAAQPSTLRVLPAGAAASGALVEQPLPTDPEERLVLARRMVADRCLYGVDKNPLAVEMARLSLWLVTLQKNRPFSFLDHALRCGDALLGVNAEQLLSWSLDLSAPVQLASFVLPLRRAVEAARAARRRLEAFVVRDVRDVAAKAALLAEAEAALALPLLGADLLAATALLPPTARQERANDWLYRFALLVDAAEQVAANRLTPAGAQPAQEAEAALRAEAAQALAGARPLHWALAFPEVFDGANPGFHALIGNPPFQGGQKITGALGTEYRNYLVEVLAQGQKGSADLCAYFFLRAWGLARAHATLGLIATNTIAQGDTREVGLDQLAAWGASIMRAVPSTPWPGAAALEVAHVWLRRGPWSGATLLDNREVPAITPFLTEPGAVAGKPYRLAANAGKSFQGSIVLGMGFVLTPDQAQALIERDPRNRAVLFPYLNGQDLNSSPDQAPSRWVINFHDWDEATARTYPEPYNIVLEQVKPERAKNNRAVYRDRWWHYGEKRPALYNTIAGMERVLALAIVSRTVAFAFVPNNQVFAHKLVIFSMNTYAHFALLQSSLHYFWAWEYSSTMKADLNYSPTDCFETFPFPEDLRGLEEIGARYHAARAAIMAARQEGLTATYNRFHNAADSDPAIDELRALHRAMDEAVAAAYGWRDLALEHGFHATRQGERYTISERARRAVLDRLLRLNHARHAVEEAAAPPRTVKPGRGRKTSAPTPAAQTSMLDE